LNKSWWILFYINNHNPTTLFLEEAHDSPWENPKKLLFKNLNPENEVRNSPNGFICSPPVDMAFGGFKIEFSEG